MASEIAMPNSRWWALLAIRLLRAIGREGRHVWCCTALRLKRQRRVCFIERLELPASRGMCSDGVQCKAACSACSESIYETKEMSIAVPSSWSNEKGVRTVS